MVEPSFESFHNFRPKRIFPFFQRLDPTLELVA